MARTDDDSWSITESVGATALGVAAARAVETESARPLIRDEFAGLFLDRAGPGVWSVYAAPGFAAGTDTAADTVDADARTMVTAMVDFMAVRTLFFDEFFRAAADAGVQQIVILAAGLDSRAWRLDWPAGTTVYEVDQPQVLDFKAETLRGHQPRAEVVYVPVDLRQDWSAALRDEGFDTSKPTAWAAEGLLRYLTATDQDRLFADIDALSAPGSRVATNSVGPGALDPAHRVRQHEQLQHLQAVAARLSGTEPVHLDQLWYAEERSDVASWLTAHGWTASAVSLGDLLATHGRAAAAGDLMPNEFITAER